VVAASDRTALFLSGINFLLFQGSAIVLVFRVQTKEELDPGWRRERFEIP